MLFPVAISRATLTRDPACVTRGTETAAPMPIVATAAHQARHCLKRIGIRRRGISTGLKTKVAPSAIPPHIHRPLPHRFSTKAHGRSSTTLALSNHKSKFTTSPFKTIPAERGTNQQLPSDRSHVRSEEQKGERDGRHFEVGVDVDGLVQ